MARILPENQRFRLFSVQHNGQYLFVSNDLAGPDRIVEAHPYQDEGRNWFRAEYVGSGDYFRLFHRATDTFLFVSNDMAGPDRIVEAHPIRDETRNRFEAVDAGGGAIKLRHPDTATYLFLSNDMNGNDYVIEAHGNRDELRNNFIPQFG